MEKKKDVLELILSGENLTKKTKTKRGTFIIRFPLPRDLRAIEVRVAEMLDGKPVNSFSTSQVGNFRAYATLDQVIVDGPDWWKKLDTCEDCPDDVLITTLYGRYLRFYHSTQESINKSGYEGGIATSESGSKT